MAPRILCVDDDPSFLKLLGAQLSGVCEVEVAPSAEEAMLKLGQGDRFAVVVSDLRMKGMQGLELLGEVARLYPDTQGVLLTGYADTHTAIRAINQGHVYRLLTKPYERRELMQAVADAIKQHELTTERRVILEETLGGCVRALTEVLGVVGPRAYRRAIELKRDVAIVARAARLEPVWEIEIAALLSQLGHITVPTELEKKYWSGASLNAVEQEILERVPECGFSLLRGIPRLENVTAMVLFQSKHWDGTGRPEGQSVSGDAIPAGARLLKILGDRQTLRERGHSSDDAWKILESRQGIYDPHLRLVARESLESDEHKADIEARHVQLDMLALGDRLLAEVRLMDGRLLLSPGQVVTVAILERLKSFARLSPIREPLLISPPTEKRAEPIQGESAARVVA